MNNFLLPPLMQNFGLSAPTLGLNQIEGFTPVQEFTDANGVKWQLVKSSFDSSIDIPDPKNLQVLDYWNHDFPGIKTKLYIYVVEGIKQPRVETEQPTHILFQWFSQLFVPAFTPQMITDREWLKANVYAAPVTNTRLSKLNALCRVNEIKQEQTETDLLKVNELKA